MILSMIAAADEDDVIGLGNTLPWDLPADMKYFREKTKGHPVIMGRKTFESIVERRGSPLPDRRNIVITQSISAGKKNINPQDYDIDIVPSIDDAIALAQNIVDQPSFFTGSGGESTPKQGEAFVIGGGQTYELAMPFANRIYLTRIHGHFEGDTYFPSILEHEWELVNEERNEADPKNVHAYSFLVYERVRK